MPRGSSAKREREYNELKTEFKKERRYRGREEQVAARIVNKQRSRFGETKGEKKKDRQGKSPDRNLPIKNYQHKTIAQVERAIEKLSRSDLQKVERYEKEHKNRKTVIEAMHRQTNGNGSHQKSKSSSNGSTHRSGSSSRSHQGKSSSHSRSSNKSRAGDRSTKSRSSRKSSGPARSRGSSRSHSSSRKGGSDHGGHVTTDHDEIRRWVEERGGHPATVQSTVKKGQNAGLLRIDFPGYSGGKSLGEISWDEFFNQFEKSKLGFLYQDETADGDCSRFSKLVAR